MAEVIFNKITIQKKDLYATIKSLLVQAGWSNISSNPVTDYDVFYSNGVNGDKNLYFQIRPINADGVIASDVTTSNGNTFSTRLISKYTPGNNNASGTFERSSDVWRHTLITNNSLILLDMNIDLYYHVNKNRIIYLIDPPSTVNSYGNTVFIGLPDSAMVNEIDCRGLVFAPNICYSSPTTNTLVATSSSYTNRTSVINQNYYSISIPLGINSSRKFMFSQLAYGDTNEGIRGILDGISTTSAGPYQPGDVFTEGSKKYKVFYQEIPTSWVSGYNSKYVVIRIQ